MTIEINYLVEPNKVKMETEKIIEGNKAIALFMGGYQRDMNGTQVWDHNEWESPLKN